MFRTDLTAEDGTWIEILSLTPRTIPEMLSVPLHCLKRWLRQESQPDEGGDMEGAREEADEDQDSRHLAPRKFLIWRGRERSILTNDVGRLRPNDILVLPMTKEGISSLGQRIENPKGLGESWGDLAERALWQARGKAVLRVRRDVFGSLCDHSSVTDLVELARTEPEPHEIREALQAVLEANAANGELATHTHTPFLPAWLEKIIKSLCTEEVAAGQELLAASEVASPKNKKKGAALEGQAAIPDRAVPNVLLRSFGSALPARRIRGGMGRGDSIRG